MLSIFLAFCDMAGDNFVGRSGSGNIDAYEIATKDIRLYGQKLQGLTRIY